MRFYIHIPRYYNDLRPIELRKLGRTFRELVEEFEGSSWIRADHQVPALGIKSGGLIVQGGRKYIDANYMFFVDVQDSELVGKMQWLKMYKGLVEKRLKQHWIYIACHHISVLA